MKITSKSLTILRFFSFFFILLKYLIASKKVEIAAIKRGAVRFAAASGNFPKKKMDHKRLLALDGGVGRNRRNIGKIMPFFASKCPDFHQMS